MTVWMLCHRCEQDLAAVTQSLMTEDEVETLRATIATHYQLQVIPSACKAVQPDKKGGLKIARKPPKELNLNRTLQSIKQLSATKNLRALLGYMEVFVRQELAPHHAEGALLALRKLVDAVDTMLADRKPELMRLDLLLQFVSSDAVEWLPASAKADVERYKKTNARFGICC